MYTRILKKAAKNATANDKYAFIYVSLIYRYRKYIHDGGGGGGGSGSGEMHKCIEIHPIVVVDITLIITAWNAKIFWWYDGFACESCEWESIFFTGAFCCCCCFFPVFHFFAVISFHFGRSIDLSIVVRVLCDLQIRSSFLCKYFIKKTKNLRFIRKKNKFIFMWECMPLNSRSINRSQNE